MTNENEEAHQSSFMHAQQVRLAFQEFLREQHFQVVKGGTRRTSCVCTQPRNR